MVRLHIVRTSSPLHELSFFIVNAASTCNKSCLHVLIPTWSGLAKEGGVSHNLKSMWNTTKGRKIASVVLSTERERHTENVFHISILILLNLQKSLKLTKTKKSFRGFTMIIPLNKDNFFVLVICKLFCNVKVYYDLHICESKLNFNCERRVWPYAPPVGGDS